MPNIDVTDRLFDKNITTSYFLSIQVTLNGLSFSVLDPVRNTYIFFKHIEFEKKDKNYVKTQELLITDPVLNYDYKRVYVLFNTLNATLVPDSLFNNEQTDKVLALISRINEENVKIEKHKIKLADVWNVYSIPDYLYYLVKSQYPDCVFFHQYTPMIEVNLMSGAVDSGPLMHINLQKDIFDIVVLKRYKLQFCNSFRYSNPAEFVYFTLNSIKQLDIDIDKLKVVVSGNTLNGNECFTLLSRYVKNVKLISLPGNFEFGTDFKKVKTEEFFNLFSLPLCV